MNTKIKINLKRTWVLVICLALVLSLNVGLAIAYSGGPPNGRTNAPGESTCTACHSSFPLNSGLGTLAVSGIESTYEAGQTYDLTVSLDDPSASRWGFELTIIGEDGQAIGSLTDVSSHTQISSTATRDYLKQTSAGSQNGTTGGVTWPLRWNAPETGSGDATIYIAGNAANGNFNTNGDRIYAISQSWSEDNISAAPVQSVASAVLRQNYPNPFNPRTTIAFDLKETQMVRLAIYSLDGRLVKHLANGLHGIGQHEFHWDGLSSQGLAVPSGTYYYRMQAGDVNETRSMTLVR
ncbi:MAG: T9SS type A sorting domain-containing protein [bacterium]|nr:T9SS type A sorting domain-containing protein [bacterium]